ncbi:composite domain of metallo-dependent hydrolase [Schizophyllum commune H4-8]|uniref:Amidohydrolase-related domain-containing protein n=1 Tax=Schizophyllum commune (strain H4-8 / FGSC 9210) TaxID=578458 RepID=D8Q790_SCHCM|nr:composite domain of metallo-dependent hydrolase [Schizophyllum commune H4-8]KAI5891592.1 composite domain of metallo-dependent hydrolase [Schizophyllum commune H4-8]
MVFLCASESPAKGNAPFPSRASPRRITRVISLLLVAAALSAFFLIQDVSPDVPPHVQAALARCRGLHAKPGPPPNFHARAVSDRFEAGTHPTLVRNATIWTGEGVLEQGDILLAGGVIQAVGHLGAATDLGEEYAAVDVLDAHGAWVTPGLVDVHSHVGVESNPGLEGSGDGNSMHGTIQPWLRSLDGLNTHDDSYRLAVAGGLTTALVIPGSANAIGGQGFVVKFRPTSERSPSSMLLEPPFGLNGTEADPDVPRRWRHIKHACGENPSRVYGQTRMDTFWQFREAYETARKIKVAQDDYCQAASTGRWDEIEGKDFPDDLKWEALVDVLRGKAKVNTHCYEAVDLDDFVRLTNEFKFPLASFHHAHETYLVPDVLKRAYGGPPASAVFATFARYKREAYRHSEFAPKILHDNGLKVVMKTDHPAIVSRYLLHEAQQAHYYGLPADVALASVTSTAAEVLGMDHRVGYVKVGWDADIVLWDSHPLQLGATPVHVFVDGIPQLKDPHVSPKAPERATGPPSTPDFTREAEQAVKYEGLPPLEPVKRLRPGHKVVFTNVKGMVTEGDMKTTMKSAAPGETAGREVLFSVVAEAGEVLYVGACREYVSGNSMDAEEVEVVDLAGGWISPGLTTIGSSLGLQEITMEASTKDGEVLDVLTSDAPVAGEVVRAVDGLMFGTRNAWLAYRSGVTDAITAPESSTLIAGFSVAFSTGAEGKLEKGAIVKDAVALHVRISMSGSTSVSTQIAALRKLLLPPAGKRNDFAASVVQGTMPLVVHADNADVIATLIALKREVEHAIRAHLKMTIIGGAEAHLLAPELARANVGVIVISPRAFPYSWEKRRILPGPPLTNDTNIIRLLEAGVTVGIGPQGISGDQLGEWAVRNLRFDTAWAALESGGRITQTQALAMATTNIRQLLGVKGSGDLVATRGGGILDLESKVVGVLSSSRGVVDLL